MLPVALGLSGCGQANARDYAVQACHHVERSLSLWSGAEGNPGVEAKALAELRVALPLASLAASEDGQWQALQTTLSESSRVDESRLVHALSAQCHTALTAETVPAIGS